MLARFDCVIAYKTDRLSRGGGPGWAPLVDAFETAGRDPDRAVATVDGWVSEFEIGIRSAMDREESKKTSDRMLAVRAREAKEGIPRIAGRRAYGFSYDMSEHVPDEIERIHDAAERVLAGESVWSIASDWNAQGVSTVTGRPWTVQTITSILRSGRIAGLREHKGVVVAKGQWDPIIDEDLRDRLLVALAPKRKARKVRTYPFTRFLLCGKCGAPLRSLAREGGGRSYACRKGPGLDGCGGIRIQAEGVEHYIRDLVCGMLADPETRGALTALAETDDGESSLVEDLRAVEAKRQRLIDLYTEGDIERADFRTRRDEFDEEARAIESQMAQRSATACSPRSRRPSRSWSRPGRNEGRSSSVGSPRRFFFYGAPSLFRVGGLTRPEDVGAETPYSPSGETVWDLGEGRESIGRLEETVRSAGVRR